MDAARSGLVDTLREYLEVHERMNEMFARYRSGDLDFDSVRALVDDVDDSALFRLKERCHTLFRSDLAGEPATAPMRREALFDLAVGSLFHEAMKFRENFYQKVVYAPKVRALRSSAGTSAEDEELFREFEKIQIAADDRMDEALQETEALLAHTGEQLWVLLQGHRGGLITRYIIEQRERVGAIHADGVDALLEKMHGSSVEGYIAAAVSYLESAHFRHALRALDRATAIAPDDQMLLRLTRYADGMRAFLAGEYDESVTQLEAWVAASPSSSEAGYAVLAYSAISRLEHLVKDPEIDAAASSLVTRATRLAAKLELLLAGA